MLEEREEVFGGKRRDDRQRQGRENWNSVGRSGNRRGRGRGAVAGGEKSDKAEVGGGRIRMQTLVPSRRDAEEGGGGNGKRHQSAEPEPA